MQARQSPAPTAAGRVLCPRCRAVNRLPPDKPAAKAKCGSCREPLFAGRAIPVDEAGFELHLRRDEIPILVEMWAPWCGPCRAMAPMFEQAARNLEPEMRLLKLNVDEAPQTASRLGVQGIPALYLFREGRVLARTTGLQNAETIQRWARAHLAAPANAQGDLR